MRGAHKAGFGIIHRHEQGAGRLVPAQPGRPADKPRMRRKAGGIDATAAQVGLRRRAGDALSRLMPQAARGGFALGVTQRRRRLGGPRLAGALADAGFRISVVAAPPALDGAAEQAAGARALREMLARIAPAPDLPAPRVGVTAGTSAMAAPMMGPGWRGGGPWQGGPMAAGMPMLREVTALMPLPGGSWLAFRAGLPEGGGDVSLQFLLSMAVMAVVILGASILAVRQATRPLAALAAAADRLGRDVAAPALEEIGTTETRRAARAFNKMQARLRHLLESRMQVLAAISHNLRTPLTLLRLRVENLPETEETARMLATIGDMEAMIASMLVFARDETVTEPRRRTDLAALLESLVHGGCRPAGDARQARPGRGGGAARGAEARCRQPGGQRGEVWRCRARQPDRNAGRGRDPHRG